MINIIKMYIDKININDVNMFLCSNNINLSDKELDFIYNYLKNNYELILQEDLNAFKEIKNNIKKDNYVKLYELYKKYKSIYNIKK